MLKRRKKEREIFVTQHWKKYIACKNLCFLLNLLFLCNFACPNSSIKVGKKWNKFISFLIHFFAFLVFSRGSKKYMAKFYRITKHCISFKFDFKFIPTKTCSFADWTFSFCLQHKMVNLNFIFPIDFFQSYQCCKFVIRCSAPYTIFFNPYKR